MTTRLPGDDAAGATPLTSEDIETATLWALGRRRVASTDRLLTIAYADRVHQGMFADAWKWAGQHRTRMTNIGVEPHQITTQMKLLFDDARYWHDHSTYEPAERAVRLHHRLVSIHPYRNGNGRHARFMADLRSSVIRCRYVAGSSLVEANPFRTADVTDLAELTVRFFSRTMTRSHSTKSSSVHTQSKSRSSPMRITTLCLSRASPQTTRSRPSSGGSMG